MTTVYKKKTMPFAAFEWMLAFRYLRARRKEGFISIVALFSFLGIMLGVSILIITMSLFSGFYNELLDKVRGLNGHVRVQKVGTAFTDYNNLTLRLSQLEGVKAVMPLVEGNAMVSTVKKIQLAAVVGIRGEDFLKLPEVSSRMTSGGLQTGDKKPGIVIGSLMAEKLNVKVGDRVTMILYTANSQTGDALNQQAGNLQTGNQQAGQAASAKRHMKSVPMEISGIFEMGMSDYDSRVVFLPLEDSQKLFEMPNQASLVSVVLDDTKKTDDMVARINASEGQSFYTTDWRQYHVGFFGFLRAQQNIIFVILFMILLVAMFNIISSLVMLVKDKSKDIAVLRTMGASRSSIMRVFVITGMSIGVIGTVVGLLLGLAVCYNIQIVQDWVSLITGYRIDPKVYFLTSLKADINLVQISGIVLMSLGMTILSALYPAWRAARMDPVEALRYE